MVIGISLKNLNTIGLILGINDATKKIGEIEGEQGIPDVGKTKGPESENSREIIKALM